VDGTRNRVFVATALAGFAHLVLDGVSSRLLWTTPPYLLLDYANETFRDLLNLDRATILLTVAVISAGVNGAIAGLFAAAFHDARRRTLKLGLSLSGLWIFSGGLMALVYLSPPPGVVAGSLFAGVPRAFAVAWLVFRLAPRGDAEASDRAPGAD
jgi:membrane associated rhomboid family serine protease